MYPLTNLLDETLKILAAHNKPYYDVLWCSCGGGFFGWETFANLAAKTDYDAGYGMQEVSHDLIVAGDGWWLERTEYDGSEGWVFRTPPSIPNTARIPKSLKGYEL